MPVNTPKTLTAPSFVKDTGETDTDTKVVKVKYEGDDSDVDQDLNNIEAKAESTDATVNIDAKPSNTFTAAIQNMVQKAQNAVSNIVPKGNGTPKAAGKA